MRSSPRSCGSTRKPCASGPMPRSTRWAPARARFPTPRTARTSPTSCWASSPPHGGRRRGPALSPPRSGGRALGVANVLTQGGQRALALQAQGLPPSSTNSFYAVWLYNSQTDAQRLGFAPPVSRNGRLQAVSALPDTAARFHQLVITAETARQPSQPGHIVLAGPISLQ